MIDYPLRKGYKKKAPPEVTEAIRRVIGDWDGRNWMTAKITLEQAGCVDLDEMTMAEVRQRFAVMQKPIIIKLGGIVHTQNATIRPTQWNTIEVADPWALHCEKMEADGATHLDTAKAWKATHPSGIETIGQLKKRSEYYRAERNRQRKAAGNPP